MNTQANGAFRRIGKQKFNVDLLSGIIRLIPKKSTIIDIGARGGKYVQELRGVGYLADGIDGIPNIEEQTNGLVKWCDLSKEIPPSYERNWDWGLFIEVGEHIPQKYEFQVFDNVSMLCNKGLVVSWCDIKRGKGHVNHRLPIYVSSEFARRGWFVDEQLTIEMKNCFSSRRSHQHTIMVLKND